VNAAGHASISVPLAAQRRRAITAGIIGNTLEWFDFGVYGFLATILAREFFPASDPYLGLLQTFGAFGAGFIARPIGSVVLGRLGDLLGRKIVLLITILMMTIGTIAIGLVPNYAHIGVIAPWVLLLARLFQGFAAGGEWGNAAAFLAEWSKTGKRGLYGGLLLASVSGGLLLGSALAALLSSTLSAEHMLAWGWRIPFLTGALLLPIGIYMRRNVEESPVFHTQGHVAARVTRSQFLGLLLRASCLCLPLLMASYMVTVYMPSYGQLYAHIPRAPALWSNTLALGLTVVGGPLVGWLSDRIGRRKTMLASASVLLVVAYPLYVWIASPASVPVFIAIQTSLTILVVGFNGAVPAAVAELFPTSVRSTGAALANAIAGVIGGFTPFMSTWLIKNTGVLASPGLLVVISALAAWLAVIGMKESAHVTLA